MAIAQAGYRLYLANGTITKGHLHDNGYAKVENLPPGKVKIEFDILYVVNNNEIDDS